MHAAVTLPEVRADVPLRPPPAAIQQPATSSRAVAAPSSLHEYLTFRIGDEEYAIDILRVQEIRGYSPLTRIAHAPATVRGVVNLRGVIVPVVDLRVCLQTTTQTSRDEDTVTIVLDLGNRVVGAVVNAVSDVLTLSATQIRPAPQIRAHALADSIVGIACPGEGTSAQRILILLDIQALLSGADVGL